MYATPVGGIVDGIQCEDGSLTEKLPVSLEELLLGVLIDGRVREQGAVAHARLPHRERIQHLSCAHAHAE
jgi:hypothetical protein